MIWIIQWRSSCSKTGWSRCPWSVWRTWETQVSWPWQPCLGNARVQLSVSQRRKDLCYRRISCQGTQARQVFSLEPPASNSGSWSDTCWTWFFREFCTSLPKQRCTRRVTRSKRIETQNCSWEWGDPAFHPRSRGRWCRRMRWSLPIAILVSDPETHGMILGFSQRVGNHIFLHYP